MTPRDLFRAIGQVDDDLVEEAGEMRNSRPPMGVWRRALPLAACAAVIFVVVAPLAGFLTHGASSAAPNTAPAQQEATAAPGAAAGGTQKEDTLAGAAQDGGLPLLAVGEFFPGGMGMEALMEKSPEELENGNPWTEEMAFETLPVYAIKGDSYHDGALRFGPLDVEEMGLRAAELAEKLGLTVTGREVTPAQDDATAKRVREKIAGVYDGPLTQEEKEQIEQQIEMNLHPNYVTVLCENGVQVECDTNGALTVEYPTDGVADVETVYSSATRAQAQAMAESLAPQWAPLLGVQQPRAVTFGDYSFEGELHATASLVDDAGTDLERILNWNFRKVDFHPWEDGRLWLVRQWNMPLGDKVGDYPVITADEAQEKLLAGGYWSSVYLEEEPETWPAEVAIVRRELVYRQCQDYILPFYRFYVRLPESAHYGTKDSQTYGAYYVAAVAGEYITDEPRFNG